jgi:hypothetical protein
MNIFENFNKAKQKFGENLARQAIEARSQGAWHGVTLFPDKPRHPRQKYLLTDKGLALYKKLLGE